MRYDSQAMPSAAPAFRKIAKYEIQAELGRGGFGRVYRALDPDVKRLVAIKILIAPADHDLRARFQFEAAAAGNLRHKNIVTIYEFGEHQQQPFLVMEYLEGQTLQAVIAKRQPLSILQKMAIMSQVADGLQCAHANGVVHRDVKPANIMVLPDGAVKIMDFGIARATRQDATRLTQAGFLVGTLRYMAPEQFENIEAGVLGDIFAYGVVYYEFLTGKHPFDAPDAASIMFKITREDPPPVRQSVPDCPDALERMIERVLAKDRSLRYQSMEELQFDAEPLAVGHCRAAAKCAHAVRGSAQVVCRPAARGVVGEWAHTSGEPCREGSASALVTEAGKVMSYPSGGSDRAAESRCGSWFLSRTRDKAAGFWR